ncbi:MAG: hypothetical protein JXQ23_06465 [Clostridia bacterium]|nr:hypothetical protein [Clostridia bacterium]
MTEYEVTLKQRNPVIDDSDGHIRMVDGYRDKNGMYHVFCDFIDFKFDTVHSFQADIKYYRGKSLYQLEDMGILIKKKMYGAGSPGIAVFNHEAYLFYAIRGNLDQAESFIGTAKPGEPGYVSSDIAVNIYKCDEFDGIITENPKTYEVIKRDCGWKSMRVDDPGPVVINEKLHLFYKGFNDNTGKKNISIGHGYFEGEKFIDLGIALQSEEGFEMPRPFFDDGQYQMFIRTFNHSKSSWRHFVKEGNEMKELDYDFFNGHPETKAKDACFIKDSEGNLTHEVLACGYEQNKLKQWLYCLSKK